MPALDLFRHVEHTLNYEPGAEIYRAGEPGNDMIVVLEGELDVVLGDRVLRTLGPGEMVGEMALIDDEHKRAATVRAATKATVVPVDARQFDFLVRNHPSFAREVMKAMADRLRHMNQTARG